MVKLKLISLNIFLIFCFAIFNSSCSTVSRDQEQVSGKIIKGYRVITITDNSKELHLKVYRGDYVKFQLNGSFPTPVLSIPALTINQELQPNLDESPSIKMKETGVFPFSLGEITGRIEVIDYRQANYREITPGEAAELIENIDPVILDVRTSGEYKSGHIKGSILIPVQELQSRIKEISDYKNNDILIYCATGNRSTVASKILIDSGFKRIYNLRTGISGWVKGNYNVIK